MSLAVLSALASIDRTLARAYDRLLHRHTALLLRKPTMPNLGGIAALKDKFAKLDHAIDFNSNKAAEEIDAATTRVEASFQALRDRNSKRAADVQARLSEVHAYLDEVDKLGGNGGPPLDGSSIAPAPAPSVPAPEQPTTQPAPALSEPAASWRGTGGGRSGQ